MPNTITGLEAIELVAGIVSDYNPYREPELSSTYNGRISNQAVAFIESVFCQASLDRKPFDGHFDRGFFEYSNEVGKVECASISGSTFDSELLCQLAKKHYAPITPVRSTKQKQKTHAEAKSSTSINGSLAGKKMADIRWSANDKMKADIEKFVISEISKPDCACLHVHMVNIVKSATDANNKLIYDSEVVELGPLLESIKSAFKKVDKSRICNHRPPKKNSCKVHSNKN